MRAASLWERRGHGEETEPAVALLLDTDTLDRRDRAEAVAAAIDSGWREVCGAALSFVRRFA